MARRERPVASFTPGLRSIKLYRSGRIEYQGKAGSIIDATARVDSSGTKERFRDTRRVILRIDGPRVAIAAGLPASGWQQIRQAREFAATVNEMAAGIAKTTPRGEPAPRDEATPGATTPPPPPPAATVDLLDQLERLGTLRDSGVLTEGEFQELKARLIRPTAEP